jgi:hypothetical protein
MDIRQPSPKAVSQAELGPNPAGPVSDWEQVCVGGLKTWRFLRGPGGWLGRTWFCVGHTATAAVVLPRLAIVAEPDEEFGRLAAHLLFTGTDPTGVLLPRPVLSPADLRRPRIADLRHDLMTSGRALEVSVELVQKMLEGERDRGPAGEVDGNPAEWVALAVKHTLDGVPFKAIQDAEEAWSRDESHTRRHLNDAKRRLADCGVLPWAAWPAGKVPRKGWDQAPEFRGALEDWHRQAGPIDRCTAAIADGRRHASSVHRALRLASDAAESGADEATVREIYSKVRRQRAA